MAFIPIDAKADVENSKKGKLTPAQHSQLNAWSLVNKTGIFDFLSRCEATATTYTATSNIATVVFNKGFFVVCGRLVECEQGTEVQITTPVSGSETGWIIAKFNLSASGTSEFEVTIKKKTENLIQQDLNLNPTTGIYEFVLYDYTAYPESVTIERVNTNYLPSVQSIISDLYQYVPLKHITIAGDIIAETRSRFITFDADVTINEVTIPQSSKGTLSTNGNDIVIDVVSPSDLSIIVFYNRSNLTWTIRKADYAQYDRFFRSINDDIISINQRLDTLGFREGSVTFTNTPSNITLNKLRRQGNYVIGQITGCNWSTSQTSNILLTLPEGFRPKRNTNVNLTVGVRANTGSGFTHSYSFVTIYENGQVSFSKPDNHNIVSIIDMNFGFEAEPIS